MKKLFVVIITILTLSNISTAQSTTSPTIPDVDTSFVVEEITNKPKKDNTSNSSAYAPRTDKVNAEKHASDHILIQLGSDRWMNKPGSMTTDGGSHFNIYFMNDKPFKSNPKYSVAYGLGIGSSNIYFSKMTVDLSNRSSVVPFVSTVGDSSWDKFKVTNIFLEIPVELRYTFNNMNPSKSWKIAVGGKFGLLTKAYTKGKNLQDANGRTIYGDSYIQKEYNKNYFNSTRLSLTARVGYGNFTLHSAYTITSVFRSGAAPEMNTFSLGLCIGGM